MESSDDFEYSCSEGEGESSVEDVNIDLAVGERDGSASESESGFDSDDFTFKVLSTEQIVEFMNECINEANVVLQLPSTTMRLLLNHFRWDKNKLLEVYYDGDQEKLFRDVNVVNPALEAMTVSSTSGVEDCEICYMEMPPWMMFGMACGHRFCTNCWESYLSTKILEEGMGERITCAAYKCPYLVDDLVVTNLVAIADPKVRRRYQQIISNSFVQCNRLMRWCPSLDCTNAIKVEWIDKQWRPVTCACNHTSCFQCGQHWHDPVSCALLKKWIQNAEDEATSRWIVANTKDCPSCNVAIEKNGGCNHMTCKNTSCRAHFCWLCLAVVDAAYNHGCNLYREESGGVVQQQGDARASLERYLFHHNRYLNHRQSLKFEKDLYASVKAKMEKMKEDFTWNEVQFLKKAVDVLCKSRQALMYTYVFAYFAKKTNQVSIFEDNQRDLEAATEILSGYLEQEIEIKDFVETKQKVQDKSIYCDKRCKVLLDHVYEGYDKGWWEYDEL